MVRLLGAFFRSARAAAPSSRLPSRRLYSAVADPIQPVPDAKLKRLGPKLPPLELESPPPDPGTVGVNAMGMRLQFGGMDDCDIPIAIKPRSIKLDGDHLEIKWANDVPGYDESHVSRYSLRFLKYPSAIPHRGSAGLKRRRIDWDKEIMQRVQHWISYSDYMDDELKFTSAMRHLAITGLVFVKDIPDSREMVAKIATRMGPIRDTFYGSTWDVRSVPKAKNVAYTSQFLDFHMDLMYMKNPPGFQLLHCLQNSCEGGESLFLDSFAVASQIHHWHPEIFKELSQCRLTYEYNHEDHVYSNAWPVFEAGTPDSKQDPHLLHVNYSPPFQGNMLPKWRDYETTSKNIRALHYFAKQLEDERRIFELKLNPGECVIFENRRVLHARRQFNTSSGHRWLAGAYVDEDALLSKFQTLSAKYPFSWFGYTLPGPPYLDNKVEKLETETASKA
ncbi:hypothetical protein EYZ11_005857 [Aspergillus tanneri]|uniref:TauD/TfdA-like domain-containing protein n=1 Tax=Aspergillus tanneri TaxID=1220188 RepID=A0A4S3JH84_9EURO|nr:hypothetical protein EYZ11_005857 [Aspergillus tanneri]